ncbi:hypothetical protein ASE92_01620 [Pedobacter sp. Leaf41]|uniref:pirin family protein n=1 Tax=Pedobacter sp. Leaf41 TaxID=1736218 RepID=UPI000702A110|nr:hypothetical protein [Pedobacter sp. Leaf41]KQN38161.1 hypothetical protein ASE92_01620 [Pedobacter sp. Leaf41]
MGLTPDKLFLAEERGLKTTDTLKRYSTFNFEQFFSEHKRAIGNLFICNVDSIAAGKMIFFLSKEDSYQLFFPTTGRIDIVQGGKEFGVETGEVQVLNLGKGEVLEISNPYPNEEINYIQLAITTDLFLLRASEMLFKFDFEEDKNHFIEIVNHAKLPFRLNVGTFANGQELICKLQSKDHKLFFFVIDGTFRIDGRILKARDGLSLWDLEQVQIVSLSDNAVILVLEHL